MALWRRLARGLRTLANRSAADQDVADEVRHYLDQATAAHLARGLSPDAARLAARAEFGNLTSVREQVREVGWENALETIAADLRHAARRLVHNPGFTVVSGITLALGLGATTAIFSAVRPILLEPLPYPHADRLVTISDYGTGGSPLAVTFGTYRELVARSRSFDALAVMKPWQPTMTGRAEPERFEGQRVSAAYFHVLEVTPALGRDFDPADDRPGGPSVAILSDVLWRRRFGGDSGVVGRAVTLDGNSFTVIGVMPRAFENVLASSAEIWSLLQYSPSLPSFQSREWGHHLRMVGRLRPGVGAAEARRELSTVAHTAASGFARPPWASLDDGLLVSSLQDDVTRGVKAALLSVLGAVVLLLVIACGNVANLLLARGAERRGEFAVRSALGAARPRLVRQLLTESLLLALWGGVLGLAVAELGVRALVALGPPGLPRLDAVRVDAAAFAFALGITTVVGIAIGLIPARQASRSDLLSGLQESSRRTAGSHQLTRRTLVVAEVALALVLLVNAGLLLHSLQRLFAISPGFDASHLLTMQIQTSGHRFEDDSATHRFFAQALDAVRQVPGVAATTLTSQLPLTGDLEEYGVELESSTTGDTQRGDPALRYAVTPDYFQAMSIPLRRGRLLDVRDQPGAPPAVVISEALAKRAFPGEDAIGRRIRFGASGTWRTIVGVVGDVKQASLAAVQEYAVYVASTQWAWADQARWLVVRARGDPAPLAPALRRAIWSVDKDQPIVRVATMDALLTASAGERRFVLIVFEAFALVALLLAATGIYGVLSGGVTERTREIGVRSALGASRAEILGLVVRQGMTLTGLGLAVGLVAAGVASRGLTALLFGVSRLDPATYLGVALLLALVAALASGIPAWRAARIDPAIALRSE
ncbi:MAG TPA: ABC transporter permease [Gemmatimonadales bacterium]|nr:ABC transporter permease [Gemmatimonadales bacterium]